jgi:hypothetical protein
VDFDGIDKAVNEFRQLNGEVSEVAVIVNNSIRHTSNRASLNKPWVSDSGAYEFKVDLAAPAQGRQLSVAVRGAANRGLRTGPAQHQELRGAVHRVHLPVRCLPAGRRFVAGREIGSPSPDAPRREGAGGDIALILLKPLYFLGVFLDSLTYAFLPKFMQEAATPPGCR